MAAQGNGKVSRGRMGHDSGPDAPFVTTRKVRAPMFRPKTPTTKSGAALEILGVTFHAAVRRIRKSHRNAAYGLVMNILQSVIFVMVFYWTFELLGLRGTAVRGDFLLYIMTGVFMFMTHTKTLGAVSGAENSTSPMMKHAPMNTLVSIGAASLATLYIQFLSAAAILFFYHVAFTPITIEQPIPVLGMFLLAWGTGIGIGMIFMAARPWAPDAFGLAATIYSRANLIFSGKMFLANTLPGYLLVMFLWNPLFHIIDQTRGFVFLNYTPRYTSVSYPIKVMIGCFMVGLIAEFYTRKHASASWSAGR
jgi:ABC-type polysaccharide/polyol phosphate export permease